MWVVVQSGYSGQPWFERISVDCPSLCTLCLWMSGVHTDNCVTFSSLLGSNHLRYVLRHLNKNVLIRLDFDKTLLIQSPLNRQLNSAFRFPYS